MCVGYNGVIPWTAYRPNILGRVPWVGPMGRTIQYTRFQMKTLHNRQ